MKGEHPKRRKDKYNPYKISRDDQNCYISFSDGQGIQHEFRIPEWLYEVLDHFELEDLHMLNEWDRHIEQGYIREDALLERVMEAPETVEDIVMRKLEYDQLYDAIKALPEIQKKRLLMKYVEGMTFAEMAEREKCSERAVEYSVHIALKNLKKFFKI